MKLCYRGVQYEKSTTDMQPATKTIVGKYRGNSLSAHVFPEVKDRHPALKYRGATLPAV
ncbi:MAG: DUF4278 domain-containing protein [Coleofasciculaceae cyanobacterium SM2_3_26]|nr:DUF4278 domain-containing protein [Coleofasciculaceae cyanobacterium SM2_3_26]